VWVSVSYTTRAPRPGEVEGVQYHFIDRERFAELVSAGEMLEWAEFAGNLYGTPLNAVRERLDQGIPTLLEIELQGARQVREKMPEAQFVFLAPPSWSELERRLVGRGTEARDVIDRRLAQAEVELASDGEFDTVVVNDDVHRAARELVTLIENVCPR
jgi:guanylate kinase